MTQGDFVARTFTVDPQRINASLKAKTCYASMLLAALLLMPCTLLRLRYAEERKPDEQPAAHPEIVKPVLKPSSKRAAPQELVEKLLGVNRHWLRPDPQDLSYTFSMEHPGTGDRMQVEVECRAPKQATVTVREGRREPYTGRADDNYDPFNCASAPGRTTLLQGATLFGPLQELARLSQDHALSVAGEETINGVDAWVLHLKVQRQPNEEADRRQDETLRRQATHGKYVYELTPAMRLVHDQPRALIELKCTGEAGPGWKELMTAQQKNPAEIRWGGYWIEAVLREYHGWVRPAIVLNRDLGAGTTATVTSLSLLEGEAGGTPPTLSLGEGVQTFDEKLYQKLKAASKEPERFLPMRVGCGVFGCWYGYSGGGVDVDQFWVDKATGRILREEGFRQGEPQFVVAYGDFEKTSDNGQVPRRIVVRLLSNPSDDTYPWVFQMDFQLLDGKAWLLKELKESQGQQQNVAIAAVTGARLGAADARRTRNQPSGTTNREAALAKPADHPLPAATKGTGPGAAAPR